MAYSMMLVALGALVQSCHAHSAYIGMVPNGNKVPGRAALGHANKIGGKTLSVFGEAFKANGKQWTPALCLGDADGDGETNGSELGTPCCQWTVITDVPAWSNTGDASDPSVWTMNVMNHSQPRRDRARVTCCSCTSTTAAPRVRCWRSGAGRADHSTPSNTMMAC